MFRFLRVLLRIISRTNVSRSQFVAPNANMSDTALQVPDTLPRAHFAVALRPAGRCDRDRRGPTGLACAIEAQRAGFKVIAIDKGCVVNLIFDYPANMTFFTTPDAGDR